MKKCRECKHYEEERLSKECRRCLRNDKSRWEAGECDKNKPGRPPV